MKKVSFLIPHFQTWRWTAICLWHLKQFGIPVEQEIILVDNSPSHPSIKAIAETSLGDGIKIVSGDPEFTSHGMAYDIGFTHADGDHIFTCETDSFPFRSGWFDEYVKLSSKYDLIGPLVPQSSGHYIHPAGALTSRRLVEAAQKWQDTHKEWLFCPGAAIALGLSDKGYHVVAHEDWLQEKEYDNREMDIWMRAGPWQEMRSFDNDSFDNYPHRTRIANMEPTGEQHYLKIGYEAGQWLSYFTEHVGMPVKIADSKMTWMPGHEGRQAASLDVFGGFRHIWCGTVSNLPNDIAPDVRSFKIDQQNEYWMKLPAELRAQIEKIEAA